jgi:hypothetical protein
MKMIKNGVEKINKSNHEQKTANLTGIAQCKSVLTTNLSPPPADNSILESKKTKCTFVV